MLLDANCHQTVADPWPISFSNVLASLHFFEFGDEIIELEHELINLGRILLSYDLILSSLDAYRVTIHFSLLSSLVFYVYRVSVSYQVFCLSSYLHFFIIEFEIMVYRVKDFYRVCICFS